jgi:WD40 repeat protein
LSLRPETQSLAFSPDGKTLAAGDAEGMLTLWDMDALQQFCQWKANASWLIALAFSPDGQMLATGGNDQLVQLWDIQHLRGATASAAAPKRIATLNGHRGIVWALAFSPDGQFLVSAGDDNDDKGAAKLWSLEPPPPGLSFTNQIDWIWLSSDGRTIFGGLPKGGGLGAWDVAWGQPAANVRLPAAIDGAPTPGATSQEVSPDGRFLIQEISSGKLRVWSLTEGISLGSIAADDRPIESLFFSADSHYFVTVSPAGTAKVWNLATKQEVDRFEGVYQARLSPDGRYAAAPLKLESVTVRLRDVLNHRDIGVLRGHRRDMTEVVFSPQGDLLATASGDATVRLWHIPSGKFVGALEGHSNGVEDLAFAPDGKTLVTAANYDSIKFWQVATRQEMLSFPEASRSPLPVVFSASGTTLAVASGPERGNKIVKFWRAPSWEEIAAKEQTERASAHR